MSTQVAVQDARDEFLNELRATLSIGCVDTSDSALDEYSHDRSHHDWKRALAIVHCDSTEAVAATVRVCMKNHVAIIPRGAGTGLEGGANADLDQVVVDLSRMNEIIKIHEYDFDVVVQAGVMKSQLNETLAPYQLWFPAGPGVDASVGGMLSTRASGTHAVSYGTVRENVLQLTVVLATGEIITTGTRARKSAAGYDLTHLFVGAEGTLGIITQAVLRVHPLPPMTAVVKACFPDLKSATNAVYQTLRRSIALSRVELVDAMSAMAINRYNKSALREADTLIFEVSGSRSQVLEKLREISEVSMSCGAYEAEPELDLNRIESIWQIRHTALPASAALVEGASTWSTDVCVPISRLAECVVATQIDVEKSGLLAPIVGHVGDGNFHLAIVLPPGDLVAIETARDLNARLVERAIAMDGTCSGEHGIGRGKRESLRLQYGPAVETMTRIKFALDPSSLLNPGAVL